MMDHQAVEKHAIKIPLLNANEPQALITKWYLQEGEWVDRGTVIATIESVKVTMDIEADFSGYFFPVCAANKEASVGDVIAWILTQNQPQCIQALQSTVCDSNDIKATAPALKLIAKNKLALADFKEKRFITEKDVMEFLVSKATYQRQSVADVIDVVNPMLLYCAGNYAEVLYDAVLETGQYQIVCFVDYSGLMTRDRMFDLPIYHPEQLEAIYQKGVKFIHINTNEPKKTQAVAEFAEKIGFQLVNIIHPKASVAANAKLGKNVYVGPNAVVGPSAIIGDFTKILNCASVAHHASVGSYVQVSDGARISGNVCVGNDCVIGLNVAINNHVKIGDHVIVVSMANVTQNVPSHSIWRHDGKIVEKKHA